MLERLKHLRTVDIYGHVTCLRAQRNYMVQTEDQYVFIHDAVLEAIQSGNTEIPARGLYAHVHRMSERPADSLTGITGIQLEYRVSQRDSNTKHAQLIDTHCCHMDTAIKHPVPERVKPVSFVIFDIRAL